jgi:hypothetical protein|uniref:Uncharacterized protein n=1 Tax=viral metagenome TaxID=1070528 RepID=A0A6C0BSE8_9ZZZZ
MEVYVFFTLMGLGYMASQSSTKQSNSLKNHVTQPPLSVGSTTNATKSYSTYNDDITSLVKTIDKQKSEEMYRKSTLEHPNVISTNYRDSMNTTNESKKQSNTFESLLSGEHISLNEFTHNNMEPFFGSSIKQNMNDTSPHQSILENFTGVGGYKSEHPKVENVCFADIKSNSGSAPYSQQSAYTEEYERMQQSKLKTNELPFEQKRVGPGLNDGYTDRSSQIGFQPDDRKYAMPKSIDELRSLDNQKMTYEARTVDGLKGSKLGPKPQLVKNKVDTYYENSPDRYFKTTGAYTKDKYRPNVIIKDTNRKTSTYYAGNLYKNIGNEQNSKLQATKKNILREYGVRNLEQNKIGKPEFTYGKENILIYNNERDITATRTYEGNLTSLVKSIIAPVQDIFKPTTKQYTTFTNREFGEMQTNIPNKPTLFDPNDIAKTTIKETFIHDTRTGNIAGENKQITYDPDDVMRKTLKETLPYYENIINMQSKVTKQTIYDPSDVAKTTIRETVENNYHDGHIETLEGEMGGYQSANVKAPNTNKQFISDNEYMGTAPSKEMSHGYLNKEIQMEPTSKEFLSDNERFGGVNSKDTKQMSYQDIYNATINNVKENLNVNRSPTNNNVKLASGSDGIIMESNKGDCERAASRSHNNIQRINDKSNTVDFINLTQERFDECENKIDESILKVFHENPYTQSLNSSI